MTRLTYFLARDLHPAAWWLWALGLAVAASRTTNPWLLLTIIAVACHVVVSRRSDAPWALAFRLYLYVAGLVVVMRLLFRVLFAGGFDGTVILPLPQIPLPEAAAGVSLLGNVTAEVMLSGLYDGLRLATIIVCVGAANALANPKRLLKSLPSALHEIGTAVIVAISVLPQLAESFLRVKRARKLRGVEGGRFHILRSIIIPVLEDALERSMHLAASMDSRGYGRSEVASKKARALTGALMIAGLMGLTVGIYGLLDANISLIFTLLLLAAGITVSLVGFVLSGQRVERTRYRPDHWRAAEVVVAVCGLTPAMVIVMVGQFDISDLYPYAFDLTWPTLDPVLWFALLVGLLPSFLTPRPASSRQHSDALDAIKLARTEGVR